MMKRAALALSSLLACTLATAQEREDVTFSLRTGSLGPDHSVYLLGNLAELGNADLTRAIKLAGTGTSWQVRISLPVNTNYTYQFYDRSHHPAQVGNPTNGSPIGAQISASTSTVRLAPTQKRLVCHTSIVMPQLYWRQGTGAYTSTALVRIGSGRQTGESRYEVAAFAAAGQAVEFYLTDLAQTLRDPVIGTYTTPLDACFLQDSHLFTYYPAVAVAPQRRDYDPNNPPFVTSTVLSEQRGYRVTLPRGYDQHKSRRYPVIYAHDGWLWFDEGAFSIDSNAQRLAEMTRTGEIGEVIIVGIDHADRSNPQTFFTNRYRDFIPPGDWGNTPWGWVAGAANNYAAFVTQELKPVIDAKYRTLADREHTWTMGFSAGGLVALYLGWDFTTTFSRTGSFAGMFEGPTFLAQLANEPSRDIRVYLDSGTVTDYYLNALTVYDGLVDRQQPWTVASRLRLEIGFGQTHTTTDVAKRFGGFLRFLYPGTEAPNELLCGAVPYDTGLGGAQTLTFDWLPTSGSLGNLALSGAGASTPGMLGVSLGREKFLLGNLPLLIALLPSTITIPLAYDASGRASIPFDLHFAGLAGISVYMQAFEIRAGQAFASGGLELRMCR